MSHRTAAVVWLLFALVFAALALGTLGFGGYNAWETHENVTLAEERLAADEDEQTDLMGKHGVAGRAAKLLELEDRIKETTKEVNENRTNRFYALIILACSVIPAGLTLPFFTMFLVRMLKARAAARKAARQAIEQFDEEKSQDSEPPTPTNAEKSEAKPEG